MNPIKDYLAAQMEMAVFEANSKCGVVYNQVKLARQRNEAIKQSLPVKIVEEERSPIPERQHPKTLEGCNEYLEQLHNAISAELHDYNCILDRSGIKGSIETAIRERDEAMNKFNQRYNYILQTSGI